MLAPWTAHAAVYEPKSWYLTGSLGFDSSDPVAINASNIAALRGYITGRIKGERGLVSPNWTHWAEVSFHAASEYSNAASPLLGQLDITNGFYYLAVMPLGVTFWFVRSSFVDVGASLGGGIGLMPTYWADYKIGSGARQQTSASGGVAPLGDLRVSGRLWFHKYLALTAELGGRIGFTTLTPAAGNPTRIGTNMSLLSLSVSLGLTYSFGGVKGTGRNVVEVLPPAEGKGGAKPPEASDSGAPQPPSGQPAGAVGGVPKPPPPVRPTTPSKPEESVR